MSYFPSFFKSFFFIVFISLLFSCQTEDEPVNKILSDDFIDGVLFVSHSDDAFEIQIQTSTPAKFYPSTTKNTFDINESGTGVLELDQGLYWIDVVWENGFHSGNLFLSIFRIKRMKQ
jgi:hypothetical protein